MALGLLLAALAPDVVTIIIAGQCVGGTLMSMKEVHRMVPSGDAMRHIGVMTIAFAAGQMIGPVFASSLHRSTGSFAAPRQNGTTRA